MLNLRLPCFVPDARLSLNERRGVMPLSQFPKDQQCGFLRRNMADHDTHDRSRWMLIVNYARHLLAEAELGKRRYHRDNPPQDAARA